MILYGVSLYGEVTEWTTDRATANKWVDNAVQSIEDNDIDEDCYVILLKLDLEELLYGTFDREVDLNDQLHDEAKVLKELRWQVDDEGLFSIVEVAE
ncbi:hypothetical protein HB799_14420 [Listeria welshimeri]|nr:hypothetical protein [Listeria innocua]MBC1345236.1 hypothetical protein [Listeria welshimeri]MBC1378068.1 hypothetical protein [Listeria innocua]MBC1388524.1 hypothetical protein [Listeria innocua]